jgi:hypothetical protein
LQLPDNASSLKEVIYSDGLPERLLLVRPAGAACCGRTRMRRHERPLFPFDFDNIIDGDSACLSLTESKRLCERLALRSYCAFTNNDDEGFGKHGFLPAGG